MAINNEDLKYTTKTEDFAFENKELKKQKRTKLTIIGIVIFLSITVPLLSLFLLNYFRIIYLGNYNPIFFSLPRYGFDINDAVQNYKKGSEASDIDFTDLGNNFYSASGKIESIDKQKLVLKLYTGKLIKINIVATSTYRQNLKDGSNKILFRTSAIQKSNVGKNVYVEFEKKDKLYNLVLLEFEI